MIPRPDLLDERAVPGTEVFQITEGEVPCGHIYMEAQVFTPDSKRFVLHRGALHHGYDRGNREHAYLLCDLENGGEFTPLASEFRVTSPSVSPDGRHCYYFHDETAINGGRLALKRVKLDGTERETLCVIDGPIPGTQYHPSRIYSLSTISSDGKRVAVSAFLGDGERANAPWGLLVFDVEEGSVRLILEGPTWLNVHAQYCRSQDPEACRDIMVQENHGCAYGPDGECTDLVGGDGADIHLIRDDGTNFRNFPWGRDGRESCQGHQCWQGRSTTAITSTSIRGEDVCELIAADPVPFTGHVGLNSPGGRRNVLSRDFADTPRFYHFQGDAAGERFVSDYLTSDGRWHLYTACFGPREDGPLTDWRYILDTGTAQIHPRNHAHPFLSPDGTRLFFNSDGSGVLHAYMAIIPGR